MRKLLLLLALIPVAAQAAPQIVRSFDGPDTGVTGLACSATELYAVTGSSHKLFKLDPMSGSVLGSWTLTPTNLNGLGLAGGNLYVTNGTNTVYAYSTSGTLVETAQVFCSS